MLWIILFILITKYLLIHRGSFSLQWTINSSMAQQYIFLFSDAEGVCSTMQHHTPISQWRWKSPFNDQRHPHPLIMVQSAQQTTWIISFYDSRSEYVFKKVVQPLFIMLFGWETEQYSSYMNNFDVSFFLKSDNQIMVIAIYA